MSQRGVALATHRDVFAVPSRRHHNGGFMNPSFEAFVDPPDGFHEKPGTCSNREGQFLPPEARMVVEPRMQLLGLCSFDARRKSLFLVPKKKRKAAKYFGGGEKVIWPPNTITRRRRKKEKKPEIFPLRRRKILLLRRPPKNPIFGFGRRKKKQSAEKKIWRPKNIIGGRKRF